MGRLDDVQLHLVRDLADLDALRRWLGERRPILGLDTETTGLSLARDRLRLVQFGDARQGWAVPWEDWRGAIRELIEVYEGPIVLQNAKFDAGFLTRGGVQFPWSRTHDTMFMSHLVNSMGPKSLKASAALYVDPAARAGEAELKASMRKYGWSYGTIPLDLPAYWAYSALDPVLTALLAEEHWPRIQLYRQAYDLERACQRVLCDLELRGVRIDVDYCERAIGALRARQEQLTERLGEVNPFSTFQVVEELQRQGAQLTKLTDKGNLSVDDEVLSELSRAGWDLAATVLQARAIQKVTSSYFENFLGHRSGDRLHPHVNQIQARTGRMSITEPALQTVPRQSLVRDAFVPEEGSRLLLCDYDNEELRVAAHFSGDDAMLAAFREGRDLHGETARRVFGEGYSREQRGAAKAAMFAKAYGAGIPKFAEATGLPREEAARVFRELDRAYPGMARAMADVTRRVRERAAGGEYGWISLVDGRRLAVPADKPYVGFNFLIQGSCAVVLKQALVDLDHAGLGGHVRLPVHDEVVFDVPPEDAGEIVPEIRRIMTREDFRVPLTVGAKLVDRWGEPYREERAA